MPCNVSWRKHPCGVTILQKKAPHWGYHHLQGDGPHIALEYPLSHLATVNHKGRFPETIPQPLLGDTVLGQAIRKFLRWAHHPAPKSPSPHVSPEGGACLQQDVLF